MPTAQSRHAKVAMQPGERRREAAGAIVPGRPVSGTRAEAATKMAQGAK